MQVSTFIQNEFEYVKTFSRWHDFGFEKLVQFFLSYFLKQIKWFMLKSFHDKENPFLSKVPNTLANVNSKPICLQNITLLKRK